MKKQRTSAFMFMTNVISKYLGCFHNVYIAHDNWPLPVLDKPHSLETAFPKTVFINDHSFPKALFTTSTYEETQHFDRHDLSNLAECHKE